MEVWKDIKNYEGLYQISNLGRIKSLKEWRGNKYKSIYANIDKIIKPMKEKSGYLKVVLHNKNKKQNKRIHRLVAETFITNPNNYYCINHKDGNKENNNIENLEWCTQKYNVNHAVNNNLREYKYKGNCKKYIVLDKRYNKYYVRILHKGKKIYLGSYKNLEDAIIKRNQYLYKNDRNLYNKLISLEDKIANNMIGE